MSKVRLNPILEQLRGQVGDLVFRKYGEGVVISRKPDVAGVESTEAQRAQRERFREGVLYGKMVVADPSTEFILRELEGLRTGGVGRKRPLGVCCGGRCAHGHDECALRRSLS